MFQYFLIFNFDTKRQRTAQVENNCIFVPPAYSKLAYCMSASLKVMIKKPTLSACLNINLQNDPVPGIFMFRL